MSNNVKPPPTYQPLANEDGSASLPWILFFNNLYQGDTGTIWTPTFTSLTTVGTPTITGKHYELIKNVIYFNVTITPATSTTSTAGTTYIDNFPLVMKGNGICFAVSGLLGSNSGMCDMATNRIYVPAWTAVTAPLTIIGLVEAR